MAMTRSADRQRFWQKAIERQQASGQSIVGFCAKEGLGTASFHAWKRLSRRTGRPETAKQALVPVQILNDPASGVANLEVRWPGGVVLRVEGCDVQMINATVAALVASAT